MNERDRDRWGAWSGSADRLVSYRYLGCRSEAVGADRATGRMPLRSDMRWSAGLLGTPLAIAMLDAAGISIDGIRFGALTHVALRVHEAADDVERVRVDGQVSCMARRAIFTEASICDDDDPARIIAHGSADWLSMGEVAPGWTYLDPGAGVPDEPPMPPLSEAYTVEPHREGGYAIPALRPEVGDQLLHHGPAMVALEWHAKDLAADAAHGAALRLAAFDVRLLRGGRRPPFVTRARDAGRRDDTTWARAELVDDGGRGAVVSRIELVHRVVSAA